MSKKVCYLVSVIIHVVIVGAYVRMGSIKHIGRSYSVVVVKVISHATYEGNRKEVGGSKSVERFRTKTRKRVRKSLSKRKISIEAKRKSIKVVKKVYKPENPNYFKEEVSKEKSASKSDDISEKLKATSSISFLNTQGGKQKTEPGLGLSLPLVEKKVIPEYPYIARKRRYEGRVVLRALVDGKGEVRKIVVVKSSGYLVLDSAAISALKKWRFVPARISGRPVESWIEVPFVFNLEN